MKNHNFRSNAVIIAAAILVVLSVFGRIGSLSGRANPVSAPVKGTVAQMVNAFEDKEPRIDVDHINVKLQDMGELTTAELAYDGMLQYEKGNIPLITKHGFLMTYSAYARAGIDFSQVRVRLNGDGVKVILPKSEVQLVYVDPESISFYDESHALFQGDEKEDLRTALIEAEADANEHMDFDMVLSRADSRAEQIICDVISELAGDIDIVVEIR